MKKEFLILGLLVILLSVSVAYSTWDYPGWDYRQEIKIYNPNSEDLTNFQVKMNVKYQEGMKSDYSDLRFVDANGNELPYFIESYNSTDAIVWIEVLSLPSGENTTIYMYYGNPDAESESDPNSVFEFYDDFNGNSLDMSKWDVVNTGGTHSVSNGYLYTYAYYHDVHGVVSKYPIFDKPTGFAVEIRAKVTEGYEGNFLIGLNKVTSSNPYSYNWWYRINDYKYYDEVRFQKRTTSVYTMRTVYEHPYENYAIHTFKFYNNSVYLCVHGLYNDIYSYTDTVNSLYGYNPTGAVYLYLYSYYYGNVYVDWVRVFKIAQNDPVVIFGEPIPHTGLDDAKGDEVTSINYTSNLYGYSDINPNLYLSTKYNAGDNLSLVYHGENYNILISNWKIATQEDVDAGVIDLDIYPFYAMYPGKIYAKINSDYRDTDAENAGYYITKTEIDAEHNLLNITVLSFDQDWNSIDAYLSQNNITPSTPKIIFDLFDPEGNLVTEQLIFSNKTFSIPLPEDFSRDTYRFYYNGIWSDTIAPNVSLNYPENGLYYYENITSINFTITDDNEIISAVVEIDGINYTLSNVPGTDYFINSTINLGEGRHYITVYATDIYNNTRVKHYYFDVFESPVIGWKNKELYISDPNELIDITIYPANGTGILSPLKHELGKPIFGNPIAYKIDTKSLILSGKLNSNCSNLDVLSYNHTEVPFALYNCGNDESDLITLDSPILYIKLLDTPVNHATVPSVLGFNREYLSYPWNFVKVAPSYGGKELPLVGVIDDGSRDKIHVYLYNHSKFEYLGSVIACNYNSTIQSEIVGNSLDEIYLVYGGNGTLYVARLKGENTTSYPTTISLENIEIIRGVAGKNDTILIPTYFIGGGDFTRVYIYIVTDKGEIINSFDLGEGFRTDLFGSVPGEDGFYTLVGRYGQTGEIDFFSYSGEHSVVCDNLPYPGSNLVKVGDWLYFLGVSGYEHPITTLMRCNIKTKMVEDLVSGTPYPMNLYYFEGKIYGTPFMDYNINQTFVYDMQSGNASLFETDGYYWTDAIANLSGEPAFLKFENSQYSLIKLSQPLLKEQTLGDVVTYTLPEYLSVEGKPLDMSYIKYLDFNFSNLETGEIKLFVNLEPNQLDPLINYLNNEISDGHYLVGACAENIYGEVGCNYKEFYLDREAPVIDASANVDGDKVNISYQITDLTLDECWVGYPNGTTSNIPCSGEIELRYPNVNYGENEITLHAIDKAGNENEKTIQFNVSCIYPRDLGNGNFTLYSDLSLCKGAYNLNYRINLNGFLLDLNGSTLIGNGGNSSFDDVVEKKALGMEVGTVFNGVGINNGTLENMDVAISNVFQATNVTIKDTNIGIFEGNIENVSFRNVNIPLFKGVGSGDIDGRPVISFFADGGTLELNSSNIGGNIGGLTVSGKSGSKIILENVTLHDGILYVEGEDVIISNVTFERMKAINIFAYNNLTFTSNKIINTTGVNYFFASSGIIANNYFDNPYVDDIDRYSNLLVKSGDTYTQSVLLNFPLNCSEKSIIGGCLGGNRWSKYYNKFDTQKLIGNTPYRACIYPSNYYRCYYLVDQYPLVSNTDEIQFDLNLTTQYGNGNLPNYNLNGIKRFILKATDEIKVDSPMATVRNYAYFIESNETGIVPHLVKYNLSNGQIIWKKELEFGGYVDDDAHEVYVTYPTRSYYLISDYKIVASDDFVCVGTPLGVGTPSIDCFTSDGEFINSISPLPSAYSSADEGAIYSFDFTINNDTIYYIYSYHSKPDTKVSLCKSQIVGTESTCTNLETHVVDTANKIAFDKDKNMIYVLEGSETGAGFEYRLLGIDASNFGVIYNVSLKTSDADTTVYRATTPLLVVDGMLLFGAEAITVDYPVHTTSEYKLFEFSNGFVKELQLSNRPLFINVVNDTLIITTGDLFNPGYSTIMSINKDLDLSTAKSIMFDGVGLMPTIVNDAIYIPFVKYIGSDYQACTPIKEYETGVVAFYPNMTERWKFEMAYNESEDEIPMPTVVVPNGNNLFVPVIHYYVNESMKSISPAVGAHEYKYVGRLTLYVLTEAPKTCADVPNSDGLHCTFNWSAPHHGYINDSGDGICYSGDCHPSCDPSQNMNGGLNLKCQLETGYNWQYCCGSDSLYQICIDSMDNCPSATPKCGDLYQPCCQPGNTCNGDLHCGCSPNNATAVCLPSGEGYNIFSNSLWGNWGAFLYNNQACCASGWENIVIS